MAERKGQPYFDCARCSTSAVRGPWLDWRADRRNGSEGALPIESRRKQEQIAERWHPETATRSERYRELFCVPILLTFREEIAESQLDFVLGVASKHIGLQAQMDAELHNNGLIPFVVLGDLFPMSGIRRVALEQVQNAVQVRSALDLRAVTSSWSRNPETPMRQSAAFLFYVVGLHAGPRSQHSYDRDGATCDGLAASISRFVRDAIGWVEVIQARLFRGFFDGLFEGIWMYQDARLSQVAARARQSAAFAEVSARIEVEAGRDTHGIVLQLYSDASTGPPNDRFRLIGRPGDDPSVSVARIESVLKNAGLTRITLTKVVSRQESIATLSSKGGAAAQLSVPL
jgi:hypothetical protein